MSHNNLLLMHNLIALSTNEMNYFTIVPLENGLTVKISSPNTFDIKYRINKTGAWKTLENNIDSDIANVGDIVQIKGSLNNTGLSNSATFSCSKRYNVNGNVMSLLYGDIFNGKTDLTGKDYAFTELFKNSNELIDASGLILPATKLSSYCYCQMFYGCTSLTSAPALPATTLTERCYYEMFYNCSSLTTVQSILSATILADSCYRNMFYGYTSLTSAPALPATTLKNYCYYSMFFKCTSLVTAPALPARNLTPYCYGNMFEYCTSLVNAPELPATTLAKSCYEYMFMECTSLATAPELSATTLAVDCYIGMFLNCTSLTTAPALPATTLANYCYYSMFNGCSSLITAPELPATTLASDCYGNMFSGCSKLVNAPSILPATTLAYYCYSRMFYNCTSLVVAPELPSSTLYEGCYARMFYGCSKLSYIALGATDISASSSLTNWVSGVARTGLFLRTKDVSIILPKGESGVPDGWTILEYTIYHGQYFTISSNENNNSINLINYTDYEKVYYSRNNSEWQIVTDPITGITINEKIRFKCARQSKDSNPFMFVIDKKCDMFGNIMSLCYGDDFKGKTNSYEYDYAFKHMFASTPVENCGNLILSAVQPGVGCYAYMFENCKSLVTAPIIEARIISDFCCDNMFFNCTSLVNAPLLQSFYAKPYCYRAMFGYCTSLVTAPNSLPATTLAECCYSHMFYNCESLSSAPKLSAALLAYACCENMFNGCSKLKVSPNLNAKILVSHCYEKMFYNCSSLSNVTMNANSLASDVLSVNECLNLWLYGVSKTGTLTKNKALVLSASASKPPSNWTINEFEDFNPN